MDAALQSIDLSLAALGRATVLDRLAAGTTGDRVRRMLGDLGLAPAHELERLYEWHDGTLTSLMETLAAAYETGIFFVDASGNLEVRDSDFAGLAAELNPSVEWWKD